LTKELSESLIQLIKDDESNFNNFREILRILEKKLADIILYDSNEKIKTILVSLFNDNLLNTPNIEKVGNGSYASKNVTIIYKTKMSQTSFAQKLTECLKAEGFQHYNTKVPKKLRFDNSVKN
jgi:hypothetical protein